MNTDDWPMDARVPAVTEDELRRLEAENRKLTSIIAQLCPSESAAVDDQGLLRAIIETLPAAVILRNTSGEVLFVNDVARDGSSAVTGDLSAAVIERLCRAVEASPDKLVEEKAVSVVAGRTLLTSHRPVRAAGGILILSASFDITERVAAELELERRANSDELTGLATRAVMQQRVENRLRQGAGAGRFALAFIDLDNFKHVNDFYSHSVGDALIVKIAQRIGTEVREGDLLARISGDEFVLLIDRVEDRQQLQARVDRILELIKRPFYIEGYEVLTSASIGVSVFPEHGRSYEILRRNADTAMYRAKSGAKGGAVFFNLEMSRTIAARMEMEQRLRLAIRDRRFRCAFQPKVDITNEEVVGFETLIRWRDDDGMVHSPGAFVGLATELGLIDPITLYVAADAIRSLDMLDDLYGPGKTLSINVAAKQAGDPEFMRSLVAELVASGHARRFMLEVTEDAIIAKNQFHHFVLPMLRESGIRVSIDDFGTGYSSLSALADITADEIKIDRSFVTAIHQRPRSQSVLKTIESLGHSLGMSVVAEGVETFEELSYLKSATRINIVQGYYYARPFFLEDALAQRRGVSDSRITPPARERAEMRSTAAARQGARPGRQRAS